MNQGDQTQTQTEAEVDQLIDKSGQARESKTSVRPAPAEVEEAMEQAAEDLAERTDNILSIFDAQDEEGNYLYSDDEVRQFIPLMLILSGRPISDSLSPNLLAIMDVFLADVGLDRDASAEELSWACDEYYERYPLHPDLAEHLREVIKS